LNSDGAAFGGCHAVHIAPMADRLHAEKAKITLP
jgi:hypothetical protein